MADNRFKVMAVGTFKESAVDCPVQLKKYQIIYDVVADKTYLRVIFESFSNKKIIGVFLNIDCADVFEQKFADVEKAAVNVECDKKYSEFGKGCSIIIPKGTKTVKAYISRVVFSDITVWENQDLTFVAPVSDLKPYTAIKEKNQLEKELAKRNYVAKYLPVRYEKSWRCTCGHLNGNLNDVCSACMSRASILFNIFDDKNLEICKKEDTYNKARKFDASKDYLQASKLYITILDYKDSKVLFAKALENSKEAIYNSALDTLKTAQQEENFDSAIKSLSSISEYKDAKIQIEKAKEQKKEFIYNQALQRVKRDDVGKNDFDKSISDMQRISLNKDSPEKIKEIDAQKRAFLDKKEHARKMKKVRNISIVACVITAIVIAILIPYFVEPNFYTNETTYEEITIGDQSGYCLARYNENEDKVVIPSEYLGKPVLKIGIRAFEGKSIKEITIPESVTSIGNSAFDGCSELTSITIPDSVTSIGYSAFRDCSGLTSVAIGNSVTSIGDYAFRGCSSLTSVAIGNSVTSIGSDAFSGCDKLQDIYITDIAAWCNISGLDNLMEYDASSKNLYLNNELVTSVTIPDGVTSIPDYAFYGCSGLTSVTIPDSVTSIGFSAFSGCSSLTSITIPFVGAKAGVTSSDTYQYPFGYIFGTSSYTGGVVTTQYYYGDSTSSTTYNAYCIPSSLKSVTVTGGNILYGAFRGCSGLTNVTIDDGVTSIGSSAFYGCSDLTSVTIGNSVTSIASYAFYGCSGLTNVTIPDSVTSIASYAFYGCSGLTNVTIPDSVTSIGYSAFEDCSSLASVTIGNSVTSIGGSAFSGCSSLESITIPFVGAKAGVTSSDTYQYQFGYIFGTSSYDGGVATKQYYYGRVTSPARYNTYYIPSSLKSVTVTGGNILRGAFSGCSGLTSVTIPDSVTSIGYSAFEDCSGLTSITIPDSVTSIGYDAFYGCSGLTSVTIPDSVTSIGVDAFYGCSGLTSVTIGNSVTSIRYNTFEDCSGLTSITIPDSVTSIGEAAFSGCSGLKKVFYVGSEEQWKAISIGSDNSSLTNATRHYYSECIHNSGSSLWRYDSGGNISTSLTVGDWIVDIEATCTTNGSKHGVCNVCGETVTLKISALGHNIGDDGTCTVCGEEILYTITNDATYAFVETDGVLQSTNKAHSSSSSYVINATKTITITFEYKVSSESNYDKFYIYHNTTQKVVKSGTSNSYTSYSITLNAGDTLTFKYTKDGSQSSGNDCCYIKNLTITNANN